VNQLTYVMITPYSLLKSRTGGIFGRVLALGKDLSFVGARMYAPSDAMVDAYLATLDAEDEPEELKTALRQYVNDNLRGTNPFGISNRVMLLLFEGPNAIDSLRENVVGELSFDVKGDTLRGTYGDFVRTHGKLFFFEPAVLTPTNDASNRKQLKVFSDFAMSDGGIITNLRRSSLPGNIIDAFSRTGLFIVGANILQLTTQQGEEFYGPLRSIFISKLKGQVQARAGAALDGVFGFAVTEEMKSDIADVLKEANAEFEFRQIVNYMTGRDEAGTALPPEERGKSVALLYQGENAIEKIRQRLGATDPSQAEDGTVRSIYGYDLMKNGAHASDSAASAERERKIVGLWEEGNTCDVKETIENYLSPTA